MAMDTHIKFDGVEGESTHEAHKGEVEVLSWSWGVSNVGAGQGGGGSGVGRAQPANLNILHNYDKASPLLAKKCAQGVHFPVVVLTARKAGEGQKDFLKVTMKEVFITSVAPSDGGGGTIVESVSMSYGEIDFSYKPQDAAGGLGGEIKFGWNVKTSVIT
jgi:type VI secretion system secreted protein Hcp